MPLQPLFPKVVHNGESRNGFLRRGTPAPLQKDELIITWFHPNDTSWASLTSQEKNGSNAQGGGVYISEDFSDC